MPEVNLQLRWACPTLPPFGLWCDGDRLAGFSSLLAGQFFASDIHARETYFRHRTGVYRGIDDTGILPF